MRLPLQERRALRPPPLPDEVVVLVCHCHAVTDRRVEDALAAGAAGLRGVVRATHAGTGCGGCLPQLRALCARAEACRDEAALQEMLRPSALAG